MQIKIIHRFYATDSLTSIWDKDTSNICKLCKNGIANILHTFYECPHVITFWANTQKWLNKLENYQDLTFTNYTVLLGMIPFTFMNCCINHIILYAKHFIHLQRKHNQIPLFSKFLHSYKYVLITEKELFTLKLKGNMFQSFLGKFFAHVCSTLTSSD